MRETPTPLAQTTCKDGTTAHYWKIGELIPGQARDVGICCFCGATKRFPLFMVDRGYDDLRVQRPNYLASEREIAAYMAERTREN